MTVVLASGFKRCDRRCYDGATPRNACDCICGGRNHGAGFAAATGQLVLFQRIRRYRSRSVLAQAVSVAKLLMEM